MFSQASVILSTGVCVSQHALGQTPTLADTPLGRHPPADPLGRHTLPGQTPPSPRQPLQRTVRILLECILVRRRNGRPNIKIHSFEISPPPSSPKAEDDTGCQKTSTVYIPTKVLPLVMCLSARCTMAVYVM